MPRPVVVYYPGDEPLPFVFAASDHILPANSFVVLDAGHLLQPWRLPADYTQRVALSLSRPDAEALVKILVERYGKTGVGAVEDFSEKGLAAAFTEAEAKHAAFLRDTLTPVLVKNAEAREAAKKAGLSHVDSPEAVQATLVAKEWQLLG